MAENFSNNYEYNDSFERSNENNITSFDDSEKLIQDNYLKNKDNELAKELAIKQLNESNNLRENIEKQVLTETREKLDKEAMINEAKTMLYEKLGIDDNQNNNSSFENFEKGIVDELVLNNYDLAIQVWETNGQIILDGLSQLASWEGLKQVAEAIGESFWSLLTGNAYEKGKSVAELGLIGTGVGAGVYVGKKTVKLGMKEISKLRINKENLVTNLDVKNVVSDTNSKINDIITKQDKDIQKEFNEDLIKEVKKENLKTLELIGTKEYFNKELKGLSDKLGFDKLITVENYIDNGANGALFEIPGTNMAVKIPREDFKGDISIEINKHTEIYNLYLEWKNKTAIESSIIDTEKIKIPRVVNEGGYYTMENLKEFTSLETYLSREILKDKLKGKLDGINLDSLNFEELNTLREKLGIEEFNYNNLKLGLIDSKDFEIVKKFFSYMNYSGLSHGDIHIGNIMLDKNIIKNGNGLYAIDFGTFGETGFRDIITDRQNLSIKEISDIINKTTRDEMFDFEYPDLVRIERIFKNLQK